MRALGGAAELRVHRLARDEVQHGEEGPLDPDDGLGR